MFIKMLAFNAESADYKTAVLKIMSKDEVDFKGKKIAIGYGLNNFKR